MRAYSRPQAACAALVGSGLLLLATAGFAHAVRAQSAATSHQRPSDDSWLEPVTPTSPALVAEGRRLFLESCAHCHGADVSGDEGPDLRGLQVSDRYIATMIRYGEPHEMPAFAKKHGNADLAALTAYLRSLPAAPEGTGG